MGIGDETEDEQGNKSIAAQMDKVLGQVYPRSLPLVGLLCFITLGY